jgi:hypothetical protein
MESESTYLVLFLVSRPSYLNLGDLAKLKIVNKKMKRMIESCNDPLDPLRTKLSLNAAMTYLSRYKTNNQIMKRKERDNVDAEDSRKLSPFYNHYSHILSPIICMENDTDIWYFKPDPTQLLKTKQGGLLDTEKIWITTKPPKQDLKPKYRCNFTYNWRAALWVIGYLDGYYYIFENENFDRIRVSNYTWVITASGLCYSLRQIAEMMLDCACQYYPKFRKEEFQLSGTKVWRNQQYVTLYSQSTRRAGDGSDNENPDFVETTNFSFVMVFDLLKFSTKGDITPIWHTSEFPEMKFERELAIDIPEDGQQFDRILISYCLKDKENRWAYEEVERWHWLVNFKENKTEGFFHTEEWHPIDKEKNLWEFHQHLETRFRLFYHPILDKVFPVVFYRADQSVPQGYSHTIKQNQLWIWNSITKKSQYIHLPEGHYFFNIRNEDFIPIQNAIFVRSEITTPQSKTDERGFRIPIEQRFAIMPDIMTATEVIFKIEMDENRFPNIMKDEHSLSYFAGIDIKKANITSIGKIVPDERNLLRLHVANYCT